MQDLLSVRSYRPDIDGLRAIAILSVVLFHASGSLLPGGFTGVDVFFVISGYLIGGHIDSDILNGSFSFLAFYKRRAKRILPAFYFMLFLVIVFSLILLSPLELKTLAASAIASLLSVSNVYFYRRLGNYFSTEDSFNPLLMTWSLGVEEQFYALAPLLMVFISRVRRSLLLPAIVILTALSFAFALYQVQRYPNYAFYLLPTRAWELGVGVALALIQLKRDFTLPKIWAQTLGILGFLLIVWPMFSLTQATPFPGASALPSVLGAALVIMTSSSWINQSLLSLAPVVFVGRISYSWYLMHYPILIFMGVLPGWKMPLPAAAAAVVLSFFGAVFSYYFIERPFRRSNRPPWPLLVRYASITAVFLLAFVFLRQRSSAFNAYGRITGYEQEHRDNDGCGVDYGADMPLFSKQCNDTSDTRPSVVLWGDSHAQALAPALRDVTRAQGYKFIEIVKPSCLPLIGAAKNIPDYPQEARHCIHFNHEVLNTLLADKTVRTVTIAGEWSTAFTGDVSQLMPAAGGPRLPSDSTALRDLFFDALVNLIRPLQDAGIRVVLFDDVPRWDFTPMLRYRTEIIPGRRRMALALGEGRAASGTAAREFRVSADRATEVMRAVKQSIPALELIELKSAFCNQADECTYIADGELLYWDTNHLTADGARFALRGFRFPG